VVAAIKPVVVSPDAPPSLGILASTSGGHPGAVRRTIVQPGGRKISKGWLSW